MRAVTYKRRTLLLTALLACGSLIVPQPARCHEPIVTNVKAESILATCIPLSNFQPLPEQKPTSAVYSPQEMVTTKWQIHSSILDSGDQKTVQTKCVSADWISSPEGTRPPQCDTAVAAICIEPRRTPTVTHQAAAAIAEEDGVRKPALSSMPVPQEIVQVQWSIKSRSGGTPAVFRNTAAFQAERCPLVVWNSDTFVETPETASLDTDVLGSTSEITVVENGAGETQAASVELRVSPTTDQLTLNELQELTTKSDTESGVTYLSELSQLLEGQSRWLFANEELLDLAPEECSTTAVSYMDDLNALVRDQKVSPKGSGYRKTVATQQSPATYAPDSPPPTPKKVSKPYTSIAPDPACNGNDGADVSTIFQSVSSIRLNGLSTSPPSLPRDAVELTAELPRPENRACQYLDADSPSYYATPQRYGARHPSRDTYAFWHRPLYFQDANLENCGQTSGCLTPAASSVHFAASIAFSPYLMAAEHPADCVRSLPDCPTCHSFD